MALDNVSLSVLVGLVFFGAGLVKGVLGMGLPTFAMGFLGLLMAVPQAAALLTWPSLATNLWQALRGGALRAVLRRLWTVQLGIAAGVAVSALLPSIQDGAGRVLLGACLLAYGAVGIAGWRLQAPPARVQRLAGPAVGLATGMVTGFTGVFVLPAVPYLQAVVTDRTQFVQALGLSFTTSTLALGGLLLARGDMHLATSVQSALALVPALLGMWVGQAVREALSEAAFRRCFYAGMACLGGWLLLR